VFCFHYTGRQTESGDFGLFLKTKPSGGAWQDTFAFEVLKKPIILGCSRTDFLPCNVVFALSSLNATVQLVINDFFHALVHSYYLLIIYLTDSTHLI
jgi:hypothetical protein